MRNLAETLDVIYISRACDGTGNLSLKSFETISVSLYPHICLNIVMKPLVMRPSELSKTCRSYCILVTSERNVSEQHLIFFCISIMIINRQFRKGNKDALYMFYTPYRFMPSTP